MAAAKMHRHQKHQRIDAGERAPVKAALSLIGFVARDDRDRGSPIPVGDSDPRAGWSR
jgi:hypothetical protein